MRPPISWISAMNCCSRRINTFCPLSQNTLFECHFVSRRLHYGFLQNSLIFYRIIIKLIPILTGIIVPWYHSFHRVSNLNMKINKICRGPPTCILCLRFARLIRRAKQVKWWSKAMDFVGMQKKQKFTQKYDPIGISNWRHTMVDGTKFWISYQQLTFLSILSHWQLIQNLAPSTIVWRQCNIWIFRILMYPQKGGKKQKFTHLKPVN